MSPLTPARRSWTADERKKLDDLTKAGKIAAEIATALQRTPHSIYSQLQRLDIKRKKKAIRRLVELGLKAKGK
jgi:IS30 family transposase